MKCIKNSCWRYFIPLICWKFSLCANCARGWRAASRADDLFTADQNICTWAPLLEIRNQATLRHWITGSTRNLAVFPGCTVQWRLGRFMRFMFMQNVRFLWICWIYCLLLCMHVIFNSLVLLICMSLNAIKIASRFLSRPWRAAVSWLFKAILLLLSLIFSQGLA